MLKKVYTSNAPEAIGPYSQAIICGNMLFTSGQIPINPATAALVDKGAIELADDKYVEDAVDFLSKMQ